MEELKMIIAANIAELRRSHNFTQAELAEKLNYSDKAVSKWERGESVPDVSVLKSIADLFGVKVDYLLTAEHSDETDVVEKVSRRMVRNRAMVTGISVLLVWLVATLIFSNVEIAAIGPERLWMVFVYAVPVSFIVWLVFNSMWFNRRHNFLIVSLLMWSTLAAVFLTIFSFSAKTWLLFAVGIPGQAIILLWSGITPRKKNSKELKKSKESKKTVEK